MGVRRWMAGAAMAAAVVVSATPALAQDYGGTSTTPTTGATSTSTTEVEGTTTSTTEGVQGTTATTDGTDVGGVIIEQPTPGGTQVRGNVLARTGGEILRGVAIGGTLVALGAVFVAGTRRRRTAA